MIGLQALVPGLFAQWDMQGRSLLRALNLTLLKTMALGTTLVQVQVLVLVLMVMKTRVLPLGRGLFPILVAMQVPRLVPTLIPMLTEELTRTLVLGQVPTLVALPPHTDRNLRLIPMVGSQFGIVCALLLHAL